MLKVRCLAYGGVIVNLEPGDSFGKWTVVRQVASRKWTKYYLCRCACGTEKEVAATNLVRGLTKSCGCPYKNQYRLLCDGVTMSGSLPSGREFFIDAEDYPRVKTVTWYATECYYRSGVFYVSDCSGSSLHKFLLEPPKGYEVDHIDLNPLNNRRGNLRLCTHQQNQCNQPLQRNNSSGVTGVSFYPRRGRYRARIKASQLDIHLGYFDTFVEAVQARNEGMKLMFGEYARLNRVPPAPQWIKDSVYGKCSRHFDKAAVSVINQEALVVDACYEDSLDFWGFCVPGEIEVDSPTPRPFPAN